MTEAVVVVGGAGGIGRVICAHLAARGNRVVVADLNEENGRQVAAALAGEGHAFQRLDVTDEHAVAEVFRSVDASSRIRRLVIISGGPLADVGQDTSLGGLTLDQWRNTVALNLTGTFLCIQQFARLRAETPVENGRVVACGSLAGQLGGLPTGAAYSASKAGVHALVRQAAAELAGQAITVNAIAPGAIGTPEFYRFMDDNAVQALQSMVPLNRVGTPEDIASLVEFLISPSAGYITGATLDINGGILMR